MISEWREEINHYEELLAEKLKLDDQYSKLKLSLKEKEADIQLKIAVGEFPDKLTKNAEQRKAVVTEMTEAEQLAIGKVHYELTKVNNDIDVSYKTIDWLKYKAKIDILALERTVE